MPSRPADAEVGSSADLDAAAPGPRPVRLRGHHLLCILTYAGKGYSDGFVAAMDRVVDRIRAGAPIDLVAGPDDICAAHMAEEADPHCVRASAAERDVRAVAAFAAQFGLTGTVDGRIAFSAWDAARDAFRAGTIRDACEGCPWGELCTAIAAADFTGTRFATPLGPDAPA